MAGCTSDGNSDEISFTPGVTTTANEFTLKSNVVILGPGVGVVAIDDGSVTLNGAVPAIVPGNVIIKNEGPQTFVRTVVSVALQGGQVVVTTAAADLADVFESANIRQVEVVDPQLLAGLTPNLPGVTFSVPGANPRVDPADVANQSAVRVDFDNTPLKSSETNQVFAVLNGHLDVTVGFEKVVNTADNLVSFNPFSAVQGEVTILSQSDDYEAAVLHLSDEVLLPLQNVGELPVTGSFQLRLDLAGNFERGSRFTLMTTGDGNFGQVGVGQDLQTGARKNEFLTFDRNWTATDVLVRFGSLLDFSGSLCTVKAGVSYAGIDGVTGQKWTLPLMPFRAAGALDSGVLNGEGVEGVRFSVSEQTFVPLGTNVGVSPAGWLVFTPDVVAPPAQSLFSEFFPLPNRNSLTDSQLDPPPPYTLRVGESIVVTAVGQFGVTGGGGRQGILGTWSFLEGTTTQRVELSPTRGPSVRITGLTPGVNQIEVDYTGTDVNGNSVEYDQIFVFPVTVIDPTYDGFAIEGKEDGQFLPGSTGEQWNLADFEKSLQAVFFKTDQKVVVTGDAAWSTSDIDVAEVVRPGVIRLKRPGTVTIEAVYDGVLASRTVEILPPGATALRLTPPPPALLQPGSIHQFSAFAALADNTVRDVTGEADWFTTDGDVLVVDDFGVVTGVEDGQAHAVAVYRGAVGAALFNVGRPAVTNLEILPGTPTVNQGGDVQLQVHATFADGTFADVADMASYLLGGTGFTVDGDGLLSGLTPGTYFLSATFRNAVDAVQVIVNGPTALMVVTQPPASVSTGQAFSVTAEVQDADGNVVTDANPMVQLKIAVNPSDGELSGTTMAQAVNGVVTFNGLSIDQPGTGYQLVLQTESLGSAFTDPFNVTGPPPPPPMGLGNLFVANNVIDSDDSVSVLQVAADGTLSPAMNSPVGATTGLSEIVRLGNFLYGGSIDQANMRSGIDIFSIDDANAQLTLVDNYNLMLFNPGGAVHMATNGVNALFALTEFSGTLSAVQVDPATGTVLQQTDETIPGGGIGRNVAVLPGMSSDLVFVGDAINGFGPAQIHVYGYNRSVNPPTLTYISTAAVNAGGSPGGLAVQDNRLYVTNADVMTSSITRFDIDTGTGTLGNQMLAFTYSGAKDPGSIFFFNHPAQGTLAAVGNTIATSISLFKLEANGNLTELFETPTQEINPQHFMTFAPGPNVYLAVSLSNTIQMFSLDQTTAQPMSLDSSSDVENPGSLAR